MNAGDSVSIQWAVQWPDSHKGPMLDYLAPCNGDCETVDKTTLQFFKIDQVGYINGSDPGIWGDDVFINSKLRTRQYIEGQGADDRVHLLDNSTWLVQIPEDIAPGNCKDHVPPPPAKPHLALSTKF